jgi:hypothetical protein
VKRELEKRLSSFAVVKAEMIMQRANVLNASAADKGGTITCDYDIVFENKETHVCVRDWFRATKFIQPVNGELKITAVVRQRLRQA